MTKAPKIPMSELLNHVFDHPEIALYVGGTALIVAMVCLTIVAISNSASRNISLALGVTFGSLLALSIQIGSELRPSLSASVIGTELTTDHLNPKIMQSRYPLKNGPRFTEEASANKFLLATRPDAFQVDQEKLWNDMSLFSVVLFLWIDQHDWQVNREKLTGSIATIERANTLSQADDPSECTKVPLAQLQEMLRGIGNLFVDYKPMIYDFMCLPPRSALRVEPDAVVINTPLCEVRLAFEQAWAMTYGATPEGANKPPQPLLADGRPRFETRIRVLRTSVKFSAFRAQSRDMPKYQAWANDLVERARGWFTTEITDSHPLAPDFN